MSEIDDVRDLVWELRDELRDAEQAISKLKKALREYANASVVGPHSARDAMQQALRGE